LSRASIRPFIAPSLPLRFLLHKRRQTEDRVFVPPVQCGGFDVRILSAAGWFANFKSKKPHWLD
jgi:hypothetical protein